ncbi:cell cycle checkpoint protein RAD1 isoform X2 [Pelecanus crispus]|uniref:cell cycle checkpoint protein RAD1 isoform X2 n=1 Tax=Pelecanus crispus TaxID=36300 RepID=UPI003F5D49BD
MHPGQRLHPGRYFSGIFCSGGIGDIPDQFVCSSRLLDHFWYQLFARLHLHVFCEYYLHLAEEVLRNDTYLRSQKKSAAGLGSTSGTSTALRMCYRGYGYPLMLFLEEGGVVTVCKINTQEPDELLDFDFCSTKVVNKIILQSEGLRQAFAELDMTSEVLQITMSPDKPYFRLSTFGNAGSAHLDYPRDSDLMEAFHCNQTQTNRYKISLLKPSTKALALSCKVSIRTDAQGFLSLQYMIRNEDGQICFVEYYCCPDEDINEVEP